MDATITVRMDTALRRRVAQRGIGRRPWIVLICFAVVVGISIATQFVWFGEDAIVCAVPLAGAVVMSCTLLLWTTYWAVRSAANTKRGDLDTVYRITEDGIHHQCAYETGILPWHVVERVRRFPDMWLIYQDKVNAHVLPTDQLTAEVQEFIIRKVRENGGKVQ